MSNADIQARIMTVLKPYVRNEAAFNEATLETHLLKDLEINSARLVDVLLGFEDEFDVEIDDEDADVVQTLGDVVGLVASKIES